ncbi:RHS repeat-associated core domain-containing protein [Pseudoxanthomonas wuyuanensis]
MAVLLWALALGASAQTVRYIHTDALGSVAVVTDQNRNVVERREYEPYGRQLTPAIKDGPGFTGHVQDAATGLTYMQQRYYDPQIGLFLSVDPINAIDDPVGYFNRYVYGKNNPYRFTDPDGRGWFDEFLPPPTSVTGNTNPYASIPGADRGDMQVVGGLAATATLGAGAALAVPATMTLLANPGAIVTAGEVAMGATGVTGATTSALGRAREVQALLSPRTQRAVTTAVVETKQGVRVFGSSEGALRPAQRAGLQVGEVAAKGVRGTHAEVNAANGARAQGLTPVSVSPSRPACAGCQQTMQKQGIEIIDGDG